LGGGIRGGTNNSTDRDARCDATPIRSAVVVAVAAAAIDVHVPIGVDVCIAVDGCISVDIGVAAVRYITMEVIGVEIAATVRSGGALPTAAARALAAAGDLDVVSKGATSTRVEAVGHLIGVGTWSSRSAAVLKNAAAQPTRLVAFALNTPEYLTT
jgi:hypothetical protein